MMEDLRSGRRERVLIVDDVDENRTEIRIALADNYRVDEAIDKDDAIRQIESARFQGSPFTVMLTDMFMAGDPENGLELIEWAEIHAKELLGIAITHTASPSDRLKIRKAGALDALNLAEFQNDPVVLAEYVHAAVESAIRFRSAQEELEFVRKFTDPEVRELIRQNSKEVQLQSADATILFWDLIGFTKLTEAFRARGELVADLLRDYYDLATEVVAKNGGILDKFIGDGVMAIFGFRKKGDAGATDALYASLEFRERFGVIVERHRQIWEDETGIIPTPEVGVRCGIDTGIRLLVGITGTKLRDHFTAFGPEVNRASRIEGAAAIESPTTAILVSSPTRTRHRHEVDKLRRPAILFGDVKDIELKGIETGRVLVYPVLGFEPSVDPIQLDPEDDLENLIQPS